MGLVLLARAGGAQRDAGSTLRNGRRLARRCPDALHRDDVHPVWQANATGVLHGAVSLSPRRRACHGIVMIGK